MKFNSIRNFKWEAAMKKNMHTMLLILGIVTFLFILSCEKKEEAPPAPEKTSEEVTVTSTIDTTALMQKEMNEKLQSILQDLEAKQAELLKKREELKNEIEALRSKQNELMDMQAQLKTFQIVSIVLLILGLIAIIVGGIMIFRSYKFGGKEEPVAKEKAAKPVPEAEEKKKKEEKKAAEKPKQPKPRTRNRKAPPESGEEKK